ncbi:MAG: YaaL family protein [Defluviitaleaceae bacterium]|nr:YaaL family protein [Defluviitaleaceae bacterium]MCL2240504.1 YaaL family protein [Defluviitaleaceae bacterium]
MAQVLQFVGQNREAVVPQALSAAVEYPAEREKGKVTRTLSAEDFELVQALEAIREELAHLHSRFDQVTDEILTDALIFELKAAGLKYKYYHNKLKEKGIVHGVI